MTYLLLRNNKESGPFSLEGLRETGLGPKDLVWVEGQSVCWLPPAEIQELRKFLDIPGKQVKQQLPEKKEEKVHEPEVETVVPAAVSMSPKKRIHVTVPAKENSGPAIIPEFAAYLPKTGSENNNSLNRNVAVATEEPVVETKYSRPLDELKELYARDLEKRRKKKGFTLTVSPAVKKFGIYAAFIAVGLMAGILIRNSAKKNEMVAEKVPNQPAPVITPENPAPVTEEIVNSPGEIVPAAEVTEQRSNNNTGPVTEIIPDTKNRSVNKKVTENDISGETVPPEKVIPAKTVEKPKTRDADVREARSVPAVELTSMVSVKSNDYIVGSFGGIKNLRLTVTNSSAYKLDRVTVELEYLKPLDELLKSENIIFKSIAPGGSQTLAVPKSSRGVKVRFRVTRIDSDEVSGNTAVN